MEYLVFTRMPGESYCRRLGSLLCLFYEFRTLINSEPLCVDQLNDSEGQPASRLACVDGSVAPSSAVTGEAVD